MDFPTPSPTTTFECTKQLGQADFVDVFQDWETLLVAIFASAVLALPAVSVYFRNTEERPMRSYFYSCLVKFIVAFFTVSVLAGDMFHFIKSDCSFSKPPTVPFMAAVLTELAEMTFDYGRLVICFADPGKIDFYQNIRWNSRWSSGNGLRSFAVFLASAPIVILMAVMWIFVFIGNFDPKKMFIATDFDDSTDLGFYVALSATFGTLTLSFMGAYYLLRMCCPFASNNGEERGLGFFWSRFKIVAVDLPSVLPSIFVRPSSLILFWTAEFINDIFPYLATMVTEKYFLSDEENSEDAAKHAAGDSVGRIGAYSEIDLSRTDVANINFKRTVETYRHSAINYDDSDLTSRARLARSMEHKSARKVMTYKVDRIFPELLAGEMDESEWSDFCDRVDNALEPIGLSKSKNCTLILLKTLFIFLGVVGSIFFWSGAISLRFGDDVPSVTSYVLAAWVPLVYLCVKGCFRRNITAEFEVMEQLEQICLAENITRANVRFILCMEDETMKMLKTWCCRGGLSCARSFESIRCIECHVIYNSCPDPSLMEEGKAQPAVSSSTEVVNVGANIIQNTNDVQEGSNAKVVTAVGTATKEAVVEIPTEQHHGEDSQICESESVDVSAMSNVKVVDHKKKVEDDHPKEVVEVKDCHGDGSTGPGPEVKDEDIAKIKDDEKHANEAALPKEILDIQKDKIGKNTSGEIKQADEES